MTCHSAILLLLLVIATLTFRGGSGLAKYSEVEEQSSEEEEHSSEREEPEGIFLLVKSKKILKTEAGEVSLQTWKKDAMILPHDLQIVFTIMEPKSFSVPRYLDSEMVFYVLRGSTKVGWVRNGDFIKKWELVEREALVGRGRAGGKKRRAGRGCGWEGWNGAQRRGGTGGRRGGGAQEVSGERRAQRGGGVGRPEEAGRRREPQEMHKHPLGRISFAS